MRSMIYRKASVRKEHRPNKSKRYANSDGLEDIRQLAQDTGGTRRSGNDWASITLRLTSGARYSRLLRAIAAPNC